MFKRLPSIIALASALPAGLFAQNASATSLPFMAGEDYGRVRHVLLISIDGMHALDFENCSKGGYCPNLAALGEHGAVYSQASTPRPSDSFPGLSAQITGGSPRSTGVFYDVSYDRKLSPPAKTTPAGIVGGAGLCPGTLGTQVAYDETIDFDNSRLDGGGGINPDYLPRDPNNGCQPVYPRQFVRVNNIFEVIAASGGYTAWSDKHLAYDFVRGISGMGVNDLYTPEIQSNPIALPNLKVMNCATVPDQTALKGSWTDSFVNVQCYDSLKVQAILNEIDGYNHDGTARRPIPALFGMNFQAVSVGEKLNEKSIGQTGGYVDAIGTPSAALKNEIQFADASIGKMVDELKQRHLLDSTLIIVSAKHGQSAIDPNRVKRIPHDDPAAKSPADLLNANGYGVAQAMEDDVSLLWLTNDSSSQVTAAVNLLDANAAAIGAGGGQIYAGPVLDLMYNDTATDSRTPDIVVTPDIGVIYTGGDKKVAEHGGFAHDDTNVMLLVSNPRMAHSLVNSPVATMQIAPTILQALGLNPNRLQAVREEHTQVLPDVVFGHSDQ